MEYRPHSVPDTPPDVSPPLPIQDVSDNRYKYKAMIHWKEARYPLLASNAARLRSFLNWPRNLPPTIERISAAGFYYNGKQPFT